MFGDVSMEKIPLMQKGGYPLSGGNWIHRINRGITDIMGFTVGGHYYLKAFLCVH